MHDQTNFHAEMQVVQDCIRIIGVDLLASEAMVDKGNNIPQEICLHVSYAINMGIQLLSVGTYLMNTLYQLQAKPRHNLLPQFELIRSKYNNKAKLPTPLKPLHT